jgi:hypothetical protein
MRRFLQFSVLFLTGSALAVVALSPGCGDECSRRSDCETNQVCHRGVCTDRQASYVTCDVDADCNPEGLDELTCKAGRCVFKQIGGTLPDSGVIDMDAMTMDATMMPPDTGFMPPDSGTPPPDSGMTMDAMTMDAMTMDADTSTMTDAGTSTIADGG